MSSLHLDADDEPRRGINANSRANSVRFDETANQNHFSHSSRPSVEALSRTSSGLGGLHMNERTSSHKSEGRASSAHSMRSAASGRANSMNLDTAYTPGDSSRSSIDPPGLAPGLLLLGAIPAIIRCWLTTNFTHDALLYAAVCTGSYKSFVDLRLIEKLGFTGIVRSHGDAPRTIELPVFFPEAVIYPASSRPNSPAPQLPSLLVEFRIIECTEPDDKGKMIQIFVGSDVLRRRNADILFSSNCVTLYDDDQNKLSIPLARPESEATFKNLFISNGILQSATEPETAEEINKIPTYINGLGRGSSGASIASSAASPPPGKSRLSEAASNVDLGKSTGTGSDNEATPTSPHLSTARPPLNTIQVQESVGEHSPQTTPLRSGSSPAIWTNWRRENTASGAPPTPANGMDWASASRSREWTYQRRDTGIKVLKPKISSRTVSTSVTPTTAGTISPAEGKSRFFDEGVRRSAAETDAAKSSSSSSEAKKENVPLATTSTGNATPKTKSNPVGGASAFSWLNSSGGGTGGSGGK